MTDLQRASLTLYRVDIQAAIDRGHLRLAEQACRHSTGGR